MQRNKTTLFCLSMIDLDFTKKEVKTGFKEAYVDIKGKPLKYQIALHYSSKPSFDFDNFLKLDNDEYLIIVPIKEQYKKDFILFLEGKYSKLSLDLKKQIGNLFGFTSKTYYATQKHPSLRKELETSLNVKLNSEAEVLSIIDLKKETYDRL